MILVPDQDDGITAARKLDGLEMDLGDQRAGGVDNLEVPLARLIPHLGRDAMRAENRPRAGWDLVQLLHKNRTGIPEPVHHVLIVDDLFPYVDRGAVHL